MTANAADHSPNATVGLPFWLIEFVVLLVGGFLIASLGILLAAAAIRIVLGVFDATTNLLGRLAAKWSPANPPTGSEHKEEGGVFVRLAQGVAGRSTNTVRAFFGAAQVRSVLRTVLQVGRGSFGGIWIGGVVVLGGLWFPNAVLVLSTQVSDTESWLNAGFELFYRVFLTLAPSGDLLRLEDSEPVRLAHYLGFAFALWIAAPPLLRWLVRRAETLIARYLASGHHVIIGFGDAGVALMESLLEESRSALVVGIEIAPATGTIDPARERGAILIAADATTRDVLEGVAPERAAGIFIATGEESRNLDLAGEVADIVETRLGRLATPPKPGALPRIVAHVNDPILRQRQSRGEGLFAKPTPDGDGKVVADPVAFSSDESAVHLLMSGATQRAQETLAGYARLLPADRVHAVILGFDSIAEALIRQILQGGLALGLAPPRITVIVPRAPGGDAAEAAGAAETAFRRRYPALEPYLDAPSGAPRIAFKAYDFSFVEEGLFDLAEPEAARQARRSLLDWLERPGADSGGCFESAVPCDGVTAIFICLGSDDDNLATAMALQTLTDECRRWRTPIFLRLRADSGLDRLLSDPDTERDLARVIHAFGTDREVCSRARIFEPPELEAARAAHAGYGLVEFASTGEGEKLDGLRATARPAQVEEWLSARKNSKEETASYAARGAQPWPELIRRYRESNLDQAVHARAKLDGLGYVAKSVASDPTARGGLNGPDFTTLEDFPERLTRARAGSLPPVTQLATLEHERFMVERQIGGTRFGPERDNSRKQHHLLVPYDALPGGPAATGGGDEKAKDLGAALLTPYVARQLDPPAVWSPQMRIGLVGLAAGHGAADARRALETSLQTLLPELRRAFARAHAELLGRDADDLPDDASHVAPLLISSLAPGAELGLAEAALDALRPTRPLCAWRPTPRLLVPKPVPFSQKERDDAMADGVPPPKGTDEAGAEERRDPRGAYHRARGTLLEKAYDTPGWRLAPGDVWEVDLMPPGIPDRMVRCTPPELAWHPGPSAENEQWDPRTPGAPAHVSRPSPEEVETLAERRRLLRADQMRRGAAYVHERADWLIVVRTDDPGLMGGDDAARGDVLDWRRGTAVPGHLSCMPTSSEIIGVERPRMAPEFAELTPSAEGRIEHDIENRLTMITFGGAPTGA